MALPNMVITMDDDFWYLRSVIETAQRGRPWTAEWLTPWAASSSTLSALLLSLTGSMQFAVHANLIVAGGMAFYGLTAHFLALGWGVTRSALLGFALLALPSLFFMHLMFTSVGLYMGCLWLCAWFGLRRNWLCFTIFWCIGVAARQSAVAWLALPCWALLQALWTHRSSAWTKTEFRKPFLVLCTASIWVVALMLTMNKTMGQKLSFGQMEQTLSLQRLGVPVVLSLFSLLTGFGWSGIAALVGGDQTRRPLFTGWWAAVATPLAATAGALSAQWGFTHILATHPCYGDPFAPWFFLLLGAAAGAGLVLRSRSVRADALLAALGSCCLVVLYGGTFDYHYNDVLLWGFLAGLPMTGASADALQTTPWPWRSALGWAALLLLCAWNLYCYPKLKLQQDRMAGLNRLYEKAFREGKLRPHEAGQITFGHCGWVFEDYYAHTDRQKIPTIGGFVNYTDSWDGRRGTGVLTEHFKPISSYREWFPRHNNRKLADSKAVVRVAAIQAPILWKHRARYSLMMAPREGPRPGQWDIDYGKFKPNPFPLNDAEWQLYLEGKLAGSLPDWGSGSHSPLLKRKAAL
ncbi:MAG: hypothetical protein ACOYMN_24470, partial [Roseimicrobium sp.]